MDQKCLGYIDSRNVFLVVVVYFNCNFHCCLTSTSNDVSHAMEYKIFNGLGPTFDWLSGQELFH